MAEKKTKQAATEVTETAEPAKAKAPAKKAKKSEPAPKKYSMDGRYRLYARYVEEIVPALMNERGYKNVMQVPRIDKIVVNMRLGDVKDNAKSIQTAIGELGLITGQKPVVCKAKKSVANFKLREGMPIGAKVTLRGDRMWEFLDRLLATALPRVRDFRGLSPKRMRTVLCTGGSPSPRRITGTCSGRRSGAFAGSKRKIRSQVAPGSSVAASHSKRT